ncbi:MAG: HAD family hydrolase [Gemmatimonadetes bacterium]|nr:HAD family hydrolase [Gemmatimonadota bacterium]MDA1103630.1 HAD family hydrolase [Gemmatimonadota bacterium]
MTPRPAVFIDRDGTIIAEKVYLSDPEGVELVPGTIEGLRDLRADGFALVIVTNQAGIARGLYTLDDYHAVAARLIEVLVEADVVIDGTYYCPHHSDVTGPCPCRKPGTGMHREAAAALDLDLEASYYVGDKLSDVLPAHELGGRGILVRTGYGREHEKEVGGAVWVVDDLRSAARRIRSDARR